MVNLDYDKLGFKAGIEIHAQLKTKKKLFCSCPAQLTLKNPNFVFRRNLRPVMGEMGVFDEALLHEWEKNYEIYYEYFDDCCCTYEMDETPPFIISDEALDKAIALSLLLECEINDETAIMRKNYLDGSVTAGFQRTAFLASGGQIEIETGFGGNKKIGITYTYIEEDSARKDSNRNGEEKQVFYKLDRFGFPLIEIVTEPDMKSVDEVVHTAMFLGLLLKGSRLTRRGLGAIRQDINISIAEGNRVELKGIQKLDMFEPSINNEIIRQQKLVNIQKELKMRGVTVENAISAPIELDNSLIKANSDKSIREINIESQIVGCCLKGFNGLLGVEIQPNHSLGTEISQWVMKFTEITAIIHTDEDLSKYGFMKNDIITIREILGLNNEDAGMIIIGDSKGDHLRRAVESLGKRVILALSGVLEETRQVQSDGTSIFLRDLHGKSRLYPDTDHPPVIIKPERIERIKTLLQEPPEKIIDTLMEKHGLSNTEAYDLLMNGYSDIFLELVTSVDKGLLLSVFNQIITAIRRSGIDIDELDDNDFKSLFTAYNQGKFAKEAIPNILSELASGKILSLILSEHGGMLSDIELYELIKDVILSREKFILKQKNQGRDTNEVVEALMGPVMKEARGKAHGMKIHDILSRILEEKMKK